MHLSFSEGLSFFEVYWLNGSSFYFFYSAHQWFLFSARETATTEEFIQTFMEEFSPP
jgi:hypothetical protein